MSLNKILVISKLSENEELARCVSQEVFVADNLAEAVDIYRTVNPDLILFGCDLTPEYLREFIEVNGKAVDVPTVVTATDNKNNNSAHKEFLQAGADHYLEVKGCRQKLQQIINEIENTEDADSTRKNMSEFFLDDYAASIPMVGRSKAIRNTLKMIKMVARSNCDPVLIVGETGTGKEVVARAVHMIRCPGKPFVAVNCAALTANLLESELFGHVKGSFTSADREKTGLMEAAGTGVIFLDEISETPLELQAKLLRVLQEKTFRKVGGTKDIVCSATIITSSNRNLHREVEAKRFRRDLYYRLSTCPINIAPLRSPKRKDDIQLLAEYFIKVSDICPEKANKITSLTKLAVETLRKHKWLGNVRELRNVIERAIMLETTDKIGLSNIIINPTDLDELSDHRKIDHLSDFSLTNAERHLITKALNETGWKKTRAAALLGITRATLYAKVKHHNIEQFPTKQAQGAGVEPSVFETV